MFRQTPLRSAVFALLLVAGVFYAFFAGYYGRELLTEVAILAILAIALDLVAGFGGMISLAHGALFGAGAYIFASTTVMGGQAPAFGMIAAMLGVGAIGWAMGAVAARTRGIFFIMVTLAFGQMAHAWILESPLFGGDDGMYGIPRLDLGVIGVNLSDSRVFALFALTLAAFSYVVAASVLRSGFGRTLVGIRANEGRMRALGLSTWRHKARAFAISGALAGLAGALTAQHVQFISPGVLHWTISGEVLVIVILGGLGTLIGPVVGAAFFVFLKHAIQGWTDHWHLFVGLALIIVVMAGGRGLYGGVEHLLTRRRPTSAGAPPLASVSKTGAEAAHHA